MKGGDNMAKKIKSSEFGKEVKKTLIDKQMTQIDLASKIGVSKQQLWQILAGNRPNSKYKIAIVLALDLNLSDMKKDTNIYEL